MLIPIHIPYLPFDVLNKILQYDGKIKYSHKQRVYINIISSNDYRYDIIQTKVNNKLNIINYFNDNNNNSNGVTFYIDVSYKRDIFGIIFSKKIL